ncbi:alpha/beta hydrolase [Rhodopirellula sp. JC639]|uniref:alpha/beta hydrolase n=1 Tax=Stieleria mannarensis TaxID=2755585 RepID=UPI0015FECF9E|nr:alpha/beta hydrolase [Rhodopirellula sp. JC639]
MRSTEIIKSASVHRHLLFIGCFLVMTTAALQSHAQRPSPSEWVRGDKNIGNAVKEGIRVLRDQPYKSDEDLSDYERERCKLDWYLPSDGSDFPTLVWFHGGGLQNGHKGDDIAVTVCERFAAEGIAVASVNYRLSPKVNYPAYTKDAAAAVAFVRNTVAQYGGSPDAVFVSGHSAGGYLTSMVGMHPDLLAEHGLNRTDIAGYIPVAGQMVTHSTVRGERSIPRTRPVIDEAAPAFHATADTSPFLCFAGDNDLPARSEENRYFAAAMKAAGHDDIQFIEVAGRDHGTIASRMGDPNDTVAHAILQFIRQQRGNATAGD